MLNVVGIEQIGEASQHSVALPYVCQIGTACALNLYVIQIGTTCVSSLFQIGITCVLDVFQIGTTCVLNLQRFAPSRLARPRSTLSRSPL